MGKFLKFIGFVVLLVGIIFGCFMGSALYNFYYESSMFIIVFLPTIIISAVFSAVLCSLGNIYDVTRDNNYLLHKIYDTNPTAIDNK